MALTPIFVAIFALIFVVLSLNVVRLRLRHGVSLGDGDHKDLRIAMRMHGNYAEYVPLTLIVLWCVEQFTYNTGLVLILGTILLLARLGHIIGMQNARKFLVFRQAGIIATLGVLITGSVSLIMHYLPY